MARLPRRHTTSTETSKDSRPSKITPTSTLRQIDDAILTDTRQTATPTSLKNTDTPSQSTTPSLVAVDGPLTTATSPLPEDSSSSINWGPAITAPSTKSPLPSQSSSLNPSQSSESADFTEGSKKVLIAATTIAGTLILIFLIYALWRRRKGATYSEIFTFRRHSGTIALSTTREERLTALPIYRETRFSVRSSKIGSTPCLPKAIRYPSGVPSAAVQRFYKQNPWLQDVKRGDEPPIPTMTEHLRAKYTTTATPSTTALPAPAMTRVNSASSNTEALPLPPKTSDSKPRPSISIHAASISASTSPQDTPAADRWSWTNSQAPPTPRLRAPSLDSRRSSAPRFRKVKSWVRNQAERHTMRIEEERGPTRTTSTSARPTLKNQASKPALAPKITRKLSKNSVVTESDSGLIIQGTEEDPAELPVPEILPAVKRMDGCR